jgi:hypothetical protein
VVKRSLVRDRDRTTGGSSRRLATLADAIEEYYSSLSARERKEDVLWADLAVPTLRDRWK